MAENLSRRISGTSLVLGGVLALACNIALPHDDDDLRFIEEVGTSDSWPWLHAGLFVAVGLLIVGLHGLIHDIRAERPDLGAWATGALMIGGTMMLSALAIAGTAFRKAADNVIFVGPGQDLSGAFFAALALDRLTYALYAGAAVLLLGIVPLTIGLGLWRTRQMALLGAAGVLAGCLAVVTGLVQLTAEVDTFALYLAMSLLVTAWAVAAGVWLIRPTIGSSEWSR